MLSRFLAPSLFVVLILIGSGRATPATAQTDASPSKRGNASVIKVLPLGSFHFDSAPDFHDLMAPKQQAEIKAVVEALTRFEPTKVAVEWPYEDAAEFDSLYQAYREGRHELAVNERQQLGMRLAARLNHTHIYPIDHKQEWGMGEVLDWANKHDPEFVQYFERWQKRLEADSDSLHRNATIGDILRWYNSPQLLKRIQAARMRTLELGAGSTYVGIEPVTSIYDRNFQILANLTQIAEPGDRIVIIYGTGHSYFFREFVNDHPDMELVNPLDYL